MRDKPGTSALKRPPGHHPESTGEANRTDAKFERQYK
jgi:hypothetical protein